MQKLTESALFQGVTVIPQLLPTGLLLRGSRVPGTELGGIQCAGAWSPGCPYIHIIQCPYQRHLVRDGDRRAESCRAQQTQKHATPGADSRPVTWPMPVSYLTCSVCLSQLGQCPTSIAGKATVISSHELPGPPRIFAKDL